MPKKQKTDKPLTPRQEKFLAVLEKNGGIVTTAAKKFKINRDTHYDWMANPTYKKAVEDINESMIDFTESQLFKNIKEGSESSIFFHLKCKAKHRGYVEKVQNETVVYNTDDKPDWFDQ